MRLPPKSHPNWRLLVTGKFKQDYHNLGLKILISKLKIEHMFDNSEVKLELLIDQAYDFFFFFSEITKADIQAIFGENHE